MNLSREKLKKVILQEIEATTRFARRVSRHDREQGAAEKEFFGAPLEPPRNILDKATEKELLATIMKNDDKADIAYRALFVEKDPIAWKVYNRFKAQDKNIFGNEKEFTDEYWDGPEAKARGKELFKQAQATKLRRGHEVKRSLLQYWLNLCATQCGKLLKKLHKGKHPTNN